MLDETKMEQGRLDATGVNNISALGHLIKTQRVEYDFKYYKMEFDSDVSVLILSEGKSLLPVCIVLNIIFFSCVLTSVSQPHNCLLLINYKIIIENFQILVLNY